MHCECIGFGGVGGGAGWWGVGGWGWGIGVFGGMDIIIQMYVRVCMETTHMHITPGPVITIPKCSCKQGSCTAQLQHVVLLK